MDAVAARLIRVDTEEHFFLLSDVRVNWKPAKKWRVEKTNAFDPSYVHRSGAYFEDTIEVTPILDAYNYKPLKDFLAADGELYVEFAHAGGYMIQLPVTCSALPELGDDLREHKDETSFTLISRYLVFPTPQVWNE